MACLVITAISYAVVHSYEKHAAYHGLSNHSDAAAAAIVRAFDVQVANLESVASLFYASEEVTRDEFRRFIHRRVTEEAGTRAVWWAPRVPAQMREAFEAEAREAGFDGFTIHGTGAGAHPPTAGAYYPLWFVEPMDGWQEALGFDTASDPAKHAAMNLAIASGAPALGAPVAGTGAAYTADLFVPLFTRENNAGTPGDALEGFAGARLDLHAFLRDELKAVAHGGIVVELADAETGAVIVSHAQNAQPGDVERRAMRVEQPIETAGRPWRVVCYRDQRAKTGAPLPQPVLVLVAGLIITGLATSYATAVHTNLAQSTRIAVAEARAKQELGETLRQREKAESAQRLLTAIVEYSNDGIIAISEGGVVLSWNRGARAIYGWEAEEITGESVGCLIPADDQPGFHERLASVMSGHPVSNHEAQHQHRNGGLITVSISLSSLGGGNGPSAGISMLVRDERELRRAREAQRQLEREIQEAQKMESLGVLAGGVAHDFNNLLTGITGNAELLMDSMQPGSEAYHEASDILQAAQRAADLARQMLAYSGKGRFVIEQINLNDLIKEMSKLLAATISKKIGFTYDLAEGLPRIHADASQVRQVIVNLIVNAAEAMEERGGVITLRTFLEPHAALRALDTIFEETLASGLQVCLQVTDQGAGMSPETSTRIFEPFFTTKFTGRGLGLPAVQGIMRGHGGAILMESTPGAGTRFDVLFPATAEASHLGKPNDGAAWIGSGTVLVASGEAALRALSGRMLERIGFQVVFAEDGARAVALACAHGDDLRVAILDLNLPVRDGKATLLEIRAQRPGLPVVIASSHSDAEAALLLADARADGFLQNPYALSRLRQVLWGLLSPGGHARPA